MNIRNTNYLQRKLAIEVKRLLGKSPDGLAVLELSGMLEVPLCDIREAIECLGDEVFMLDGFRYVLSSPDQTLNNEIWLDSNFTTSDRILSFLENTEMSGLTYADISRAILASKDAVRKALGVLAKQPEYAELIACRINRPMVKIATDDVVAAEIVPMIQESKSEPLPTDQDPVKTAIADLREMLISQTPVNPPHPRWKETMAGIDVILGELGVPDHHLTRTDLRGVCKWLALN